MPTRGRAYTDTVRALILASTPSTIGVTTTPCVNTVVPACTSDPARRIASPTDAAVRIVTFDSPTRSVSSTITTASQPSGMGAPVMMRIAVPGRTASVATPPAASSPITSRVTGTWATSWARTA